MLKQRILTALVLFPLVVWSILFADKNVWIIILSVCAGFSTFELVKMVIPALDYKLSNVQKLSCIEDAHSSTPLFPHWSVVNVVFSVLIFNLVVRGYFEKTGSLGVEGLYSLLFSVVMLYSVFTVKNIEQSIVRLFGSVVGIAYGCLPWLAVWNLFNYGESGKYLMFLVFVVMGCDTGAYFGGKSFGKRKMSKNLSPNKTWEGFFFGVLSAVGFGLLANYLFSGTLGSTGVVVFVALVGSVSGILGDLIESGFKRFSGVKDSGRVLPGHGGFLDRVDAILFSAPMVWLCFYLMA